MEAADARANEAEARAEAAARTREVGVGAQRRRAPDLPEDVAGRSAVDAPLIRATVLYDAVVSVDPAWKTQTAFGLPSAFNVSVPVSRMDDDAL